MSMFSIASSNGDAGSRDRHLERIEIHRDEVDRARCPCSAIAARARARSRRASSAPWIAGCSVFTRPSSISGKPVTSSTVMTGDARRLRSVAAVPPVETISQPSCDQALGERDDPALVADRDQRARHGGADHGVGLHGFGEGGPAGRPPPRRARPRGAAGAPPRARAPRATPACRRAGPAPVPGPGSAPRSYSSSTRCTVAPLSRAPLASTASCTRLPYIPGPPNAGQQRRVDVDDASAIALDHLGGHQLEVAGEHQ